MKSISGFFIGSTTTIFVLLCILGTMRSEESLWEEADMAFYQHSYAHAERLYRKLVIESGKPKNPSFDFTKRKSLWLLRLARIHNLYLYQPVEALRYYEQLESVSKRYKDLQHLTRVALLNNLGLRLHRLSDPDGAEIIGKQLMDQYPDSDEARQAGMWLMSHHLAERDFYRTRELALYIEKHWLRSESGFMARFTVANTYLMERQHKKAIHSYESILEVHHTPRHRALVAFELGQCYQAMGNTARALEYFYTAIPYHPNVAIVENHIQHVRVRMALSSPIGKVLNAQLSIPFPEKNKKSTR